jgi:hypothetical protein
MRKKSSVQRIDFITLTVASCLLMPDSLIDRIVHLFHAGPPAKRALRQFERNKTRLQQQFFQKASAAGTPRGLRWVRCDWLPGMSLLRDKSSGEICLLAGVNISFEAIEGGDMEDVSAVSLVRDASAVFQLTPSGWQTSGRALFNMNPSEAQLKLNSSYEPLED